MEWNERGASLHYAGEEDDYDKDGIIIIKGYKGNQE